MSALIASPKSPFKSFRFMGTFILMDNGGRLDLLADSNLLLSGSLSDIFFLCHLFISFLKIKNQVFLTFSSTVSIFISHQFGEVSTPPFHWLHVNPGLFHKNASTVSISFSIKFIGGYSLSQTRELWSAIPSRIRPWSAGFQPEPCSKGSELNVFLLMFKNGSVTSFQMMKLPSVTILPSLKLSSFM